MEVANSMLPVFVVVQQIAVVVQQIASMNRVPLYVVESAIHFLRMIASVVRAERLVFDLAWATPTLIA